MILLRVTIGYTGEGHFKKVYYIQPDHGTPSVEEVLATFLAGASGPRPVGEPAGDPVILLVEQIYEYVRVTMP
jgi:hypothetical protein